MGTKFWHVVVVVGMIPLLVFAAAKGKKADKVEDVASSVVMGRVVQVLDGDTFVLASGDRVRLVDINAPEMPHDGALAEPFAGESTARLRALVDGKDVRLEVGKKERDVYGRLLAHVYVGKEWVNGAMVREGLAIAYTFADNAMKPAEILAAEDVARRGKVGLWGHPRWTVKEAATCCAAGEMGRFQVVEGVVVSSGGDKEHVYLNFGPDYRTDFTVRVRRGDVKKYFAKAGIKDMKTYVGQRVRVHGMVAPVYGAMVVVTHPGQMEIIGGR